MKHDIILAYLHALLTWPLVAGLFAGAFLLLFHKEIQSFLARLAHVKFLGNEASAPLQTPPPPETDAKIEIAKIETALQNVDDSEAHEPLLEAERLTATLWEFRYLNYYLAMGTQWVLNWFVSQPNGAPESLYNATWAPNLANAGERDAVINALKLHGLIELESGGNLMKATQKGRSYAHWPGRYGMNYTPTTAIPLALTSPPAE